MAYFGPQKLFLEPRQDHPIPWCIVFSTFSPTKGECHSSQHLRVAIDTRQPIVAEGQGSPAVLLRNNKTMDLYVRIGSDTAERERVLNTWYRRRLKEEIVPLIAKWEKVIGVKVDEWGVKRMKTKWGTCNIQARRTWLNLELIKKPVHFLEYIIVHEMVHLLERHHNERFIAYMNRFIPLWHFYREELNRAPLGHEEWEY